MNTNARYFLLPAILVAIGFSSGCADYSEMPPGEEKPKAPALPQAPPPHAKKTTAELLVGKWTRVKFLDKPQPAGSEVLLEFTHDGKFTFTTTNRETGRSVKTGVYKVMGNTVQVTSDATTDDPSRTWEITIKSINETELATESGPPMGRQRNVYKRVTK